MSYESDLERALQAGQNASLAAKQSAAKSPNGLIEFLKKIGLTALATSLGSWISENWSTVSVMVMSFFEL